MATVARQIQQSDNVQNIVEIKVEVQFGDPQSKNCANMGICDIFIPHHNQFQGCQTCAKATTFIKFKSNGSLEFNFPKKTLNPFCEQKYFSNTHFIMDSAFYFSHYLAQQLWQEEIVIPAGKYQLVENENSFSFLFPLHKFS